MLAASLYWALGRLTSSASSQPPPAQVQNLARAIIETQVELARKRLDAGDYAGAAAQAERALKLDGDNADARRIRDEARKVLSGIEAATAALTAAQRSGDAAKAGAALWTLMLLDPSSPAVAQAGSSTDGALKRHVDEARQAMTAARGAAEQAQATLMPSFSEGLVPRPGRRDRRAGGPVHRGLPLVPPRPRPLRARPPHRPLDSLGLPM